MDCELIVTAGEVIANLRVSVLSPVDVAGTIS